MKLCAVCGKMFESEGETVKSKKREFQVLHKQSGTVLKMCCNYTAIDGLQVDA